MFPNPATDQVTIKVTGVLGDNQLLLYDLFGNHVYTCSLSTSSTTVSLQNFASGVYIYEVRDKINAIARGKLVKM